MAMICVTLARPTLEELLASHRALASAGVKLVEWRMDWLAEPLDVAAAVAARPGPVIVTYRRREDGGRWQGDEADRRRRLVAASAAGAEYVDLEPDAATAITRCGAAKRIVSHHDFQGTPEASALAALHARLAACDADVVKIATLATRSTDTFRIVELARGAKAPTVALAMGELGAPSRVLALWAGAPWTYAAPDDEPAPAPGQLSLARMREHYRAERIMPGCQLLGVIGDPIAHSLSPLVHNAALEAAGAPATYVAFRVPAAELTEFLVAARALGICGLSVTIPHKEAVLAGLATIDDVSRRTGAANTLVFDAAGVHASNTDQPAALAALARAMQSNRSQPWQLEAPAGTWLAGRTALVLGAGGAAKAIVDGLNCAGAEVRVAARTRTRAESLCAALGGSAVDWESRGDVSADIVVNCTPLGMWPKVDESPLDTAALRPGMVVFDTVYNPRRTRLLAEARRAGATTVEGWEMFVGQAALQFAAFVGRAPDLEVMRRSVSAAGLNPGDDDE